MSGSFLLTLVLIIAVIISLALSVITLILLLRKNSTSPKTPKTKSVPGPDSSGQAAPPPQGAGGYSYPNPTPQAWLPRSAPVQHSDHTESLFSSHTPYPANGRVVEQRQNYGYRIQVQETSATGSRNYEITVNGECPVGRSVSNGLKIDNPTVSGQQCMLIAGPDAVFVSNRSTSNVTRLNGVMLEDTRPLKAGDTLNLGNIQLTLLDIRNNAAH